MVFDYAQKLGAGNRLGLHYSHFRAFGIKIPQQFNRFGDQKFFFLGRIREVGLSAGPRLFCRTALVIAVLAAYYWHYWQLVRNFRLRGLSYLAAPALMLIGEVLVAAVALLWLPSGRLLPPLHDQPFLMHSVADFWGRRWNLWFSDWFRYAVFSPLRRRPLLALLLVFTISGLMHELVVNVPLYLATGRRLFGSMMLYFLLQAAGVLTERQFLKRSARARILFAWLVVFAPAPLVINEGVLRTMHLWPE